MENLGRILLTVGIIIGLVGGIIMLLGRIFPGIRNLPSVTFNLGPVTCIFPIVGSILISIILTILLNIFLRMMR